MGLKIENPNSVVRRISVRFQNIYKQPYSLFMWGWELIDSKPKQKTRIIVVSGGVWGREEFLGFIVSCQSKEKKNISDGNLVYF